MATLTVAAGVFAVLYIIAVNPASEMAVMPVSTLAQLPAVKAIGRPTTPVPPRPTATRTKTQTASRTPTVLPTDTSTDTPTPTPSETPVVETPNDTPMAPDTALPASPSNSTATSAPPSATPTAVPPTDTAGPPTNTAAAPSPTLASTLAGGPAYPYLSNVTLHALQIYQQGQRLGRRPNAFAFVGDSNTANPKFFAPFEYGNYTLGPYSYLQDTINYFHGYFDRQCPSPCSPAAKGSFATTMELTLEQDLAPQFGDSRCLWTETPMACEFRLQQPSIALVLIGTGDHLDWRNFEGRYRQIVEYIVAQGVIPVLQTKADNLESSEQGAPDDYINNIIRRLAVEYDVPLLDLRKAVDPLPNRGCVADGFHYNSPPDGRTADFTGDHLNYGFNVRNLTALQALDELRIRVIQP